MKNDVLQPDNSGTSSVRSTLANRLSLIQWGVILTLFILGLGIRLYDLNDQPLDFHPTRQLRGAIIARGMYYKLLPSADPETRQLAISFWNSTGQYEPSILEQIVAYTYLVMGEENLWVSRIYTILFWTIGGITLFALAQRMLANAPIKGTANKSAFGPLGAALVAAGYYIILPFGVQASRSFQPDPGMVMWIVLSIYSLYRWSEKQSWRWAVVTGILAGLAVLVKVVAAYIVAGAAVAMVLHTLGIKRFWRNLQVWCMALLMVAPSAIYYISKQGRASAYFSSWTIALSHLLLDPSFYVRWFSFISSLMGLTVIILSLIGVLISRPRNRALLLGLWIGYAIYGLFLPYQMYTHNYYHLQLIPILALSLVPVAQIILEKVGQQEKIWQALFIGVALIGTGFPSWVAITAQSREDYRIQPAYWQEIAAKLPTDGKILALTQDYGYRLMYYGWRKVTLWPTRGEKNLAALRGKSKEFNDFFAKRTEDKSYFLITAFGQFKDQPDLRQTLYDGYPLIAEGDGYLIFDLATPSSP